MRHQHDIAPNLAQITRLRAISAPETRSPDYSKWQALFLPRREARIMADETHRTNGMWIPYPLLGFILTVTIVLGGGIIGMYSKMDSMYIKVDAMNSTMLMRDADHREEVRKLEQKLELQETYIHDIRETMAARGELKKKLSR